MKIFRLQPHFTKPLAVGIILSALLHLGIIYAYVLEEAPTQKNVKEESFSVPLSVFAQQNTAQPKESEEKNDQKQDQKRADPIPRTLHVNHKNEPKQHTALPNQDMTKQEREKSSQTQSTEVDANPEPKALKSSSSDSSLQREPVVLNANNTDQSALFTQIQKEITKRVRYPETARKMKYEGITRFKFDLLKNGTIKQARITKSSEYDLLDNAVLVAVQKASKYFPEVTKDYTVVMEIDFKITP